LAGAQAEAERAAQEVEIAGSNGDFKALADAQRRLARSEARIDKLEDGKFELESRVKAERAAPKVEPKVEPQQPTVDQVIDSWKLPESTTRYLKAHPNYVTDQRKFNALKYWNDRAYESGLELHSQAFLDYVEANMNPPKEEPKTEQPQQRTNIVSAPVSREVPSGGTRQKNGTVTLTAMEKEAASLAGITETEYAKQKLKLMEAKANGQYTGGQ
jgi:hypothetical protein